MLELFKKLCPFGGAHDIDIALVVFITLAAEIAEAAKPVQGACDDGLRNFQTGGKAAHRVRAGLKVDDQQQRHLTVSQIRLSRTHIIDQRRHPAG